MIREISVAANGLVSAYYDNAAGDDPAPVSAAPTGVAVFADDFRTIKAFAERDNSNIVHWSHFDTGGHFAALEVPDLVVGDIRTFFATRH